MPLERHRDARRLVCQRLAADSIADQTRGDDAARILSAVVEGLSWELCDPTSPIDSDHARRAVWQTVDALASMVSDH